LPQFPSGAGLDASRVRDSFLRLDQRIDRHLALFSMRLEMEALVDQRLHHEAKFGLAGWMSGRGVEIEIFV
jgi:hypothetical protein